jgi:hypothetical protein
MAKGALYWRTKDEKTGKWTYQRIRYYNAEIYAALIEEGIIE